MEQEFFQSGDPRAWSMDELIPVNVPNCRCAMKPVVDYSIDAEFVVIDEINMIEVKQ